MIAVDTSALMAVVLGEENGAACESAMQQEFDLLISAGTLAEVMIVSDGRKIAKAMQTLIDGLALQVMPVTADTAQRIGGIYARWGRGRHPANLNFGDCFAYDAASSNGCPLLFVGNDFSKTDIRSAL